MTARWGRRRAAALDDDEGGRRSTGTEAGNARWGDGPEFLLACGRRIQAAPRLRSLDLGGRGVMLVGEEQRRGREAEEGRRSAGRRRPALGREGRRWVRREEGQRSREERDKEGGAQQEFGFAVGGE